MKLRIRIVCVVILSSLSFNTYSQTSTFVNNTGSPDYLGWNDVQSFPLIVQHEGAASILFRTDVLNFPNPRMQIHFNGGIGMGANNTGTNTKLKVGNEQNRAVEVISTGNQTIPLKIGADFFSNAGVEFNRALIARSVHNGPTWNVGAFGFASFGNFNAGIFGLACPQDPNDQAGYFDGNVLITGVLDGPSDQALKSNIQSLQFEDLEGLNSLQVRKYFFNQDIESINLPEGEQYGLIAQEVKEVYPEVVHRIHVPARIDENGEIVSDTMSHLAVDYRQLISLAAKKFQIQEQTIQNNLDRLASLEERLQTILLTNDKANDLDNIRSLLIYPNPSSDQITLQFWGGNKFSVEMTIIDESGISVLKNNFDAKKGLNRVDVSINQLDSGVYQVILKGKGILLTSKLIKS